MNHLINRPCTLIRRDFENPVKGKYGVEKPAETEIETVCELQQARTVESAENNDMATARWVVFFLPAEEVAARDGLIVDEDQFEIDGDPWPVRDPLTRRTSHIQAAVVRAGSPEVGS